MSSISSYKRKPEFNDSERIQKRNKYESSSIDANRAMEVYRKYMKYHGTDTKHAKSIRKHGMDTARKTEGSASLLRGRYGLDDPEARHYNYVMTLKEAAEYAKMYGKPRIVALVVPPTIALEVDPEGDSKTAFRTHQLIPSYLVLPKHRSDLHGKQLKQINEALNIEVMPEQLDTLKRLVREEFMGSRRQVVQEASSFLQQEAARDQSTKSALTRMGIDLSSFKEGDTISIPLEELV